MSLQENVSGWSVASPAWHIAAVTDVAQLERLPPASRAREIKKAVDNFASNGRNIFVHYVEPILDKRRELLIASGTTKKRFYKTAVQIWQSVQREDASFWIEAAKELRLRMKDGSLDRKDCLLHSGILCERQTYIWHAEEFVAAYLDLSHPAPVKGQLDLAIADAEHPVPVHIAVIAADFSKYELPGLSIASEGSTMLAGDIPGARDAVATQSSVLVGAETVESTHILPLLDTLPDPFGYEQNMLYSHFARYDYDEVRRAEGKHQKAMLRQLADRFDRTGKILFYYYMVPRLCKQTSPPGVGDTVTSQAADIWKFYDAQGKEVWRAASSKLKKALGDGRIDGLETLQLDSMDVEVLRLHEIARSTVAASKTNLQVR